MVSGRRRRLSGGRLRASPATADPIALLPRGRFALREAPRKRGSVCSRLCSRDGRRAGRTERRKPAGRARATSQPSPPPIGSGPPARPPVRVPPPHPGKHRATRRGETALSRRGAPDLRGTGIRVVRPTVLTPFRTSVRGYLPGHLAVYHHLMNFPHGIPRAIFHI